MTDEEYLALMDQLPALRKEQVDTPYGLIPRSVAYLEQLLENQTDPDDRIAVYGLLLSECSRSCNHDIYLHFARRKAQEFPDDPYSYTGLASVLSYEPVTQPEALEVAALAVALARKQDRQVKYTLNCQARIALRLGAFSVFNEALRGLIEDAPVYREEDYKLEFDFLDYTTSDLIDKGLVEQYRALQTGKRG